MLEHAPLACIHTCILSCVWHDFSERTQSNHAAKIVSGAEVGSRQDTPCVVARVGDALQEPFWPEGLGINRGFLGALDCADMVLRAAPLLITELGKPPARREDFDALVERREAVYGLTKRISGTNRQKELKPFKESGKYTYTFEPGSRYAAWSEAGGGRDAAALAGGGGGGGAAKKFAAMSKATPPVVPSASAKASAGAPQAAVDRATPHVAAFAVAKRGNNLGIVYDD